MNAMMSCARPYKALVLLGLCAALAAPSFAGRRNAPGVSADGEFCAPNGRAQIRSHIDEVRLPAPAVVRGVATRDQVSGCEVSPGAVEVGRNKLGSGLDAIRSIG